MSTIQESLRQHASGAMIRLSDALEIGAKADELLLESAQLLKECLSDVGNTKREKIERLTGIITRRRSANQTYFSDREPDGQK